MGDVIYVPKGEEGSELRKRRQLLVEEFTREGWLVQGSISVKDGYGTVVPVWVLHRYK